MKHYPKLTMDDDEYALAVAHAKDRDIPLATIAKAALMAEVKRHAGRSGLLTAIEKIARATAEKYMSDALVARSHVGDGEVKRGENDKEPYDEREWAKRAEALRIEGTP